MSELKLGVYGIVITAGDDRSCATIKSDMKEASTIANTSFNLAVDSIESLVLSHFIAGVDVESPSYLEGIETAYEALGNHSEENALGSDIEALKNSTEINKLSFDAMVKMGDIFYDISHSSKKNHPEDIAQACVKEALVNALNMLQEVIDTPPPNGWSLTEAEL